MESQEAKLKLKLGPRPWHCGIEVVDGEKPLVFLPTTKVRVETGMDGEDETLVTATLHPDFFEFDEEGQEIRIRLPGIGVIRALGAVVLEREESDGHHP